MINQGLILQEVIFRSGVKKKVVAEGLGYSAEHLSRLLKRETLPPKVIEAAANYFGIKQSVFEVGVDDNTTIDIKDVSKGLLSAGVEKRLQRELDVMKDKYFELVDFMKSQQKTIEGQQEIIKNLTSK